MHNSSNQHVLLEKYTESGSLTFDYESASVSLSTNLYDLLELDRDTFSSNYEWDFECFSEHTQRLLKTRIALGEANLKPIELRIMIKTRRGEQRWLRYYCEFFGHNSHSQPTESLSTQIKHRVALVQNITQSVEFAEKSNYYQERIQLALSNTQTGTWDYDVSKNALYWDDTMYSLFESVQEKKSIKFQDWINFISIDYRDDFIDQFNASISENKSLHNIELRVRTLTPYGEDKYIDIKGRCFVSESNEIIRVVGTCQDVTEDERTRKKVLELAALAQKNDMLLQDANAARGRFIANVSHEVRTPMNAVLGALQILQSYDFNEELQGIIEMASTASYDLLNILNDVLNLAKLDANKLEVKQVDIDIQTLVYDNIEKHRKAVNEGVHLELECSKGSTKRRLGDPIKFTQIVDNLVSNAVKFTKEGHISIRLDGDESHLYMTVTDTGIGISEAAQETIFDPFRQEDESTTREYSGTGLGLAVAKKFSEYMGGTIKLSSQVGKGSEFKLTLPLPVLVENVDNQAIASLTQIVPDLRGTQILIGTDDATLHRTLAHLLRPTKASLGYEINGPALVKKFRQNKAFTLIILDAELPLTDIPELCSKLIGERSYLNIILLSEQVDINAQKRYFNAGISHIINQPMKFDAFYDALIQYKNN